MFFPESLYTLSQRDLQVTWLEPFWRAATQFLAQGTIFSQFAVPIDRVLLLQHAYLTAVPTGGQNISELELNVFITPGGTEFQLDKLGVQAANARAKLNWQGSIVVPSAYILEAKAVFNAGALGNELECSFIGMLIPNANLARV